MGNRESQRTNQPEVRRIERRCRTCRVAIFRIRSRLKVLKAERDAIVNQMALLQGKLIQKRRPVDLEHIGAPLPYLPCETWMIIATQLLCNGDLTSMMLLKNSLNALNRLGQTSRFFQSVRSDLLIRFVSYHERALMSASLLNFSKSAFKCVLIEQRLFGGTAVLIPILDDPAFYRAFTEFTVIGKNPALVLLSRRPNMNRERSVHIDSTSAFDWPSLAPPPFQSATPKPRASRRRQHNPKHQRRRQQAPRSRKRHHPSGPVTFSRRARRNRNNASQ